MRIFMGRELNSWGLYNDFVELWKRIDEVPELLDNNAYENAIWDKFKNNDVISNYVKRYGEEAK